jgi:hypothetical protein
MVTVAQQVSRDIAGDHVSECRADALFRPTDDQHRGPVMMSGFQQHGRRVASEPMIGPLHRAEGICQMLTFGITIVATRAGVIGIVDDVNDMQCHVQGTCKFAGEDQCSPAGWVAVISNN